MVIVLFIYMFLYCFIYIAFIKREKRKQKLRKMGQNKKNKYIRIYRYKYIRNKGLKYKTLAKREQKKRLNGKK